MDPVALICLGVERLLAQASPDAGRVRIVDAEVVAGNGHGVLLVDFRRTVPVLEGELLPDEVSLVDLMDAWMKERAG